jgi:hypothetical protein
MRLDRLSALAAAAWRWLAPRLYVAANVAGWLIALYYIERMRK